MENESIVSEIAKLASEMRSCDSASEFLANVGRLKEIRTMYRLDYDSKPMLDRAIKLYNSYIGLCTYINNKRGDIQPNIAARNYINAGKFLSGNRFLVLTSDEFADFAVNGKVDRFNGAIFELESGSLVSTQYWYRRHPNSLLCAGRKFAMSIRLEDYFDLIFNQ